MHRLGAFYDKKSPEGTLPGFISSGRVGGSVCLQWRNISLSSNIDAAPSVVSPSTGAER